MSAQLRFRTLVKHAGSIYDAAKEVRTPLLMTSLDDIVDKINPGSANEWIMVEHDSRRLLKVWLSREQTHASQILADQILDSLREFSESSAPPAAVAAQSLPHLEIVEKAPAPVPVATLLTQPIDTDSLEDDDEEEDEADGDDEELDADDDDEDEDEEVPAEVEEKKAPAPAPAEEEGSADDDGDGDSAAASEDEEVLEPEADADAAAEEEEEGMEVEKRTIRGRDYWLDINSNKLYSITDDDELGDEVGAIVGGRPVFMAA